MYHATDILLVKAYKERNEYIVLGITNIETCVRQNTSAVVIGFSFLILVCVVKKLPINTSTIHRPQNELLSARTWSVNNIRCSAKVHRHLDMTKYNGIES